MRGPNPAGPLQLRWAGKHMRPALPLRASLQTRDEEPLARAMRLLRFRTHGPAAKANLIGPRDPRVAAIRRAQANEPSIWRDKADWRDTWKSAKWIRRHMPFDYAAANKSLQGRNHESRKIERNTYLKRRGECIAIRYHATDIITLHQDGRMVYDCARWASSMSTKARLNTYGPLRIGSERGRMIVYRYREDDDLIIGFEYRDGMTVDTSAGGRVTGAGPLVLKRERKG